jgi:hypothetical protein
MAITKIVIKALPHNRNQQTPPALELGPDQGALIPGIGDRYMGPGFSMDVVRRKFEADGDVL